MSIYPSLEDMKATELIKAQVEAFQPVAGHQVHGNQQLGMGPSAPEMTLSRGNVYPRLHDFMGLELSEEMIRANMPEYLHIPNQGTMAVRPPLSVTPVGNNVGVGIVAPISGSNAVIKSQVTHGVRLIRLQKSSDKLGLRVRAMNTGIFACLVINGSVAATAGLRFGDQILQIDGTDMAGFSVDKVHGIFKKKRVGEIIELAVRDRPFERSITLVRDSMGGIGFQFKDGKIINIVKDSSAARNGLLTDHNLLEVNGKNVIGLKDKEITKIIGEVQGNGLVITIMPHFLYSHMVKEMASSLFGKMDHSNPDF